MGSARRRAENEAAFRAINDEIARLGARFESDPLELLCECSDAECAERIEVTLHAYEAVRAEPTHFVVVPGHEDAGVERVVERRSGYVVVAKAGEAADVASALDPRD